MANTIRIKKRAASGSAGAPSSLLPSELAFNENDLKLYYGFGDDGSTPPEATSIITVGGSGAFFNKTDTRTANTILSGPTTGSAAAPTFRALVAADIPSIAHTKISDFDTGVQANRVDQLAAATNPVTGVTPTADAHFATKGYVDSTAEGLDVKDSVKVATTANITLSGTQTIDGVAISADERVLVKDQSTASQNGIYLCKSGSWARADDMAASSDAAGAFTFIEQGSTYADVGFVCSTDKGSAVVGTNNLAFTQFSGQSSVTAGDGLDKSGNELSLDLKANGGCVIESTELAVDLSASSITGTLAVGDGGTGATSASAARTALGLAIGSNVQAYDADLDTLSGCQSGAASAIAALTSTEVGILDGATVTTSELNILDGVTSTASELNILDGVTSTTAELNILDGVTATTTELNYVDGVTSNVQTQLDAKQASDADLTAIAALSNSDGNFIVGNGSTWVAESGSTVRASLGLTIGTNVVAYAADLNTLSSCQSGGAAALAALTSTEIGILDGATVTTDELNILDGVTATASELNILDGVTATATELNYVDGVTSAIQTQLDAKQASDADLTALSSCQSGGAAALAALTSTEIGILDGATVTTSELNILDGVTATASEINILDGVTATASELNILDGVTSTASELNVLDGITSTTTELNLMDGGTSATSTTLASADRFVCNDNGTMKQVALSDLVTYLEDGSTSGFDINGGTY